MNLNEIKEIMNHMKECGLTGFNYEKDGLKLNLDRKINEVITTVQPVVAQAASSIQEAAPVNANSSVETVVLPSGKEVCSPIVGVFYDAPGPEMEIFVKAGQSFKKGETLCIIEAMKVMNEIVAEENGTILDILVSNEDVVEYGQKLFIYE